MHLLVKIVASPLAGTSSAISNNHCIRLHKTRTRGRQRLLRCNLVSNLQVVCSDKTEAALLENLSALTDVASKEVQFATELWTVTMGWTNSK